MGMNIVVVIPTYKKRLDVFEQVSLEQANKILHKYPKVFVAPESMELDYGTEYRDIRVEFFEDRYFQSTETYSKLLLSKGFYERFSEYEYMLIYQLDAFVFSDRLEEFCEMGYDYIGAPILGEKGTGKWEPYHVGNGGFSLRKISSTKSLLNSRDEIMEDNPLAALFLCAEDTFFGYCGHRKDIAYKVPSVFVASTFSVQSDVGHGLRGILKRGLPFGMHMWPRLNYRLWKPVVERYGYDLPDCSEVEYFDETEYVRQDRLFRFSLRFLRHHPQEKSEVMKAMNISYGKEYVIWGAGKWGRDCEHLFRTLGIRLSFFCDKNAEELQMYKDIPIVLPAREALIDKNVIIAVKNLQIQSEIEAYLQEMKMIKENDYMTFADIKSILFEYVMNNSPEYPGITTPIVI